MIGCGGGRIGLNLGAAQEIEVEEWSRPHLSPHPAPPCSTLYWPAQRVYLERIQLERPQSDKQKRSPDPRPIPRSISHGQAAMETAADPWMTELS